MLLDEDGSLFGNGDLSVLLDLFLSFLDEFFVFNVVRE